MASTDKLLSVFVSVTHVPSFTANVVHAFKHLIPANWPLLDTSRYCGAKIRMLIREITSPPQSHIEFRAVEYADDGKNFFTQYLAVNIYF